MTKILALDQSSKISGYSYYEDGKLIKYGKFDCGDMDLPIRLTKIRNYVIQLINEFQPEYILIEDIQLQDNVKNNVKTYKALAEVIGVISQLCNELNIPHELVPSATWKSALSIKGKNRTEQKRNAQSWVVNNYSIKPTQDECDAICIGHYFTHKTVEFNWAD